MITLLSILFLLAVVAFPLVVGFALVNRSIDLSRLLTDKQLRGPSQVRVQLLLVTIAGAAFYIAQVANALRSGSHTLPDIPQSWLAMLGISNGIYIGGKSASAARVVFNALNGDSNE